MFFAMHLEVTFWGLCWAFKLYSIMWTLGETAVEFFGFPIFFGELLDVHVRLVEGYFVYCKDCPSFFCEVCWIVMSFWLNDSAFYIEQEPCGVVLIS